MRSGAMGTGELQGPEEIWQGGSPWGVASVSFGLGFAERRFPRLGKKVPLIVVT